MLIDQGDVVLIADSQGVRDIYSADGNSIDKSTPLVVLVNKGTASASEVSQGINSPLLPNIRLQCHAWQPGSKHRKRCAIS